MVPASVEGVRRPNAYQPIFPDNTGPTLSRYFVLVPIHNSLTLLATAGSSGMASGARSATANSNEDTIGMPSPIDPLVNKLPWNARKVKARLARQVRRDVAELHRSLGIQEDAPYEDVVEAANRAIREAGSNVKARLMIERNKDKILDLRLKERLAGLTSVNMEARSQSTYEKEG